MSALGSKALILGLVLALVSHLSLLAGFAQAAELQPAAERALQVFGMRVVDLKGNLHQLAERPELKATVLVFLSSECPICIEYVPELNRLVQDYAGKPVELFGVISDSVQKRGDAANFVKKFELQLPVLFDTTGQFADAFRPTHVPECVALGADGRIAYRGRINDHYAEVGKKRPQPTTHDLRGAMDALLDGGQPPVAHTTPVGCRLERRAPAGGGEPAITFTRHIAPILYANCTQCHRPGEVAPFSLISYEDAAKRAEWIGEVTASRLMPPWKAAEGFGHFLAERRLSETERKLLATWAESGAPRGDSADMPVLPDFPQDWQLGKPDLVLEAPHSVHLPADGPDIFHHFVIPAPFAEDKMISAVEFRPGNPKVVHHAVLLLDRSGIARDLDAKSPEPGYVTTGGTGASWAGMLNVWAPGVTPRHLPDGIGIVAPKNADLVVQLHLHPAGRAEDDRSKIGIYFAKKPVTRPIMSRPIVFGPINVDIPAGATDHRMAATIDLPIEVTLTGVLPHMHLIGKEMKVTATLPDGATEPLIWIKDWNFNWQDVYLYSRPIVLPKGTKIEISARYDNSSNNPFNPNTPPQRMLFGMETTDEMCLALFQGIVNHPDDVKLLRNSLMRNLLGQISDKSVTAESQARLFSQFREFAGPELREVLQGFSFLRPDASPKQAP
jgi:thiol-disulfide isomerase/thioredoxin